MAKDEADIIDIIYESSIVPELWPRCLDELSKIPDAAGGVLFSTDSTDTRWTTSSAIAAEFDAFVESGWAYRNTRVPRRAAKRHAGFVTDRDLYTDEELEREPLYVEFFRKIGLGWAASTCFQMPGGDSLVYSLDREYAKGPISRDAVERLDRLRPHLGRAGLLACRLGLERCHAMASVLGAVGLPATVLNGMGQAVACNPLFESLMPAVFLDRQKGLSIAEASADALLQDALARMRAGLIGEAASIPVVSSGDHPPMIIHILPVKGAAHDIFVQGAFLLIVMPVDRSAGPDTRVLEGLFDLTPSEARVARCIAEGRRVKEIAKTSGLSSETVRSQLKTVLSKTGMHRQAELASLLAGKNLPFRGPIEPR